MNEEIDLSNLTHCRKLIYDQSLEIERLNETLNLSQEVNTRTVKAMADNNRRNIRCVHIMTEALKEFRTCSFDGVYNGHDTIQEVMNRARRTLMKVGEILEVGK